jgi:formylglycine-generating enzyme required for sulfatase activity
MLATEVTQAQFAEAMGSEPDPELPESAAAEVSWHQAAAFCNALSKREGYTPCYECTDG